MRAGAGGSDSPARFEDVRLDSRDHQRLADWWCSAMGYRHHVDGTGPLLWVNPVLEGTVFCVFTPGGA